MSVPHVLLVDDEPDIRRIARLALERIAGWRVTEAGSGPEAVALVETERPDAVLLDVMMPGQDGPQTLAALRALPDAPPVVFLTAKVQSEELSRLGALDVAGVLAKPFDPMTLGRQLAEVLGWPT